MADTFARLGDPLYSVASIPGLGQGYMTLSAIKMAASTKEAAAAEANDRVDRLRQARDALMTELTMRLEAVDTAKQLERDAADSPDATARSRRPQRAEAELRAANKGVIEALAAVDAVSKRLTEADVSISRAEQAASSARSTFEAATALADRIASGNDFVPTTAEEDRAQGIYAAPCFRFKRRVRPVFRSGIPKICECCKDYPTFTGFTPGLLVVACPHGHIYFLKLLRRGESPEVVFDFLFDRCRPGFLPRRVGYDNGCHLRSYIAARCPGLSAVIQIIIDRLHAPNHVHCSIAYQLDRFTKYCGALNFNTQVVEQLNRLLQRMAPHLRFSTPSNAILALCIFLVVASSLRQQRQGTSRHMPSSEQAAQRDTVTEVDDEDEGDASDDDAEVAAAMVIGDGSDDAEVGVAAAMVMMAEKL